MSYDGYSQEEVFTDIDRRVETGELDPGEARATIDAMSEARYYSEPSFTTADENMTWLLRDRLVKGEITEEEMIEAWDSWQTHTEHPIDHRAVGQMYE